MDPTLPVAPPADPAAQAPMLAAVNSGVNKASDTEQQRLQDAERDTVVAMWKEYEQARKFDKEARAQYGIDRRYAAGTANLDWAVSANLIGAFNDILVSFLFARNPDVSAKKTPRIDNTGTAQEDDFAKTVELVVSSLWKAPTARMKEAIRAQIRSVLTTGVGWLKVILVCNGDNIPQMRTQLNDLRENLALLEQLKNQLAPPAPADSLGDSVTSIAAPMSDGASVSADTSTPITATSQPVQPSAHPTTVEFKGETLTLEQVNQKTAEYNELQASLQKKMEVAIRKGLAIDFMASEDVQVSLDVRQVTDYVNAGWVANQIFRPKDKITAIFPAISENDLKDGTIYYQRANRELSNLSDRVALTGMSDSNEQADESEQYISSTSKGGTQSGEQGIPFLRIVELWNRETGHVHTMIEGIKKWAKQPYQPDYASTRFYPYFCLAFYPVDGVRHPQSLAWRLMKLQDEYHSVRSSLRLTRKRAAPGTIFNKGAMSPDDVRKIEQSTHQEFIGIDPTEKDANLNQLFAAKPVAIGDMRLYDVQPITADMEKISGVQEALQSSVTQEKTATEAEIQQSGFSARTTADRDAVETMLTDMAHYTLELAIQGLSQDDATRIAGARAFWPQGMAIEDLLTMVEVEIEAGTTGKPKGASDKAAWGTLLPALQANIMQIHQAQIMGDLPLANALTELVKETMHRMGDETDVTRFIPQMPAGMPGAPGAPGMGVPGAVPGPAGAAPMPGAVSAGPAAGVGVPDAAGFDSVVAATMNSAPPGMM